MIKNKRILIILITILLCLTQVTVFATESSVESVKSYTDSKNHTLTLDNELTANGCDGAIYVNNATTLTINGNGTVHALVCEGVKCQDETCGYSMAVYANNKSTVTINGGTYTQESDGSDQSDLIYAARESKIIITGGTFKSVTPQWTLNCKDNTNSTITVKGGRFYKFDPSNNKVSPAGQNEIIVPEGYIVVQDGDWYEVEKLNDCLEYNGVTETLTLDRDFRANGCDGAIYVHDNANLIINGTSNVYAQVCPDDGYSMAVYANNKSTVTINGGTYTQGSDGSDQSDLIYAARESKIIITGGTFKSVTPQWTLNCKDNTNSTITVKGGRFYKFDPSNNKVSPAGQNEIIVPEEYKVVQDGDWYEVVCAHLNCTKKAEKAATYTETGTEAYWICNLCSKWFADSKATTEIVDKNSIVIPKLAEVVNNNAIVTEEAFEEAINEADVSSIIVLPVLETNKTITSVTVPVNSLSDIKDAKKELLIETSEVTITIDSKALENIIDDARNAETIKIEVVKVKETILNEKQKEVIKDKEIESVISAQILANEKLISDFGAGKIKVEIPFELSKDTKESDYKFIYIADDGKIEDISFEYVDGNIIVELEHFSEYAIVREVEENVKKEEEPKVEDAPEKGETPKVEEVPEKDETPKTGSISIIFFVVVMAIIGLVITKKD